MTVPVITGGAYGSGGLVDCLVNLSIDAAPAGWVGAASAYFSSISTTWTPTQARAIITTMSGTALAVGLYLGGGQGYWRSTDGGLNWSTGTMGYIISGSAGVSYRNWGFFALDQSSITGRIIAVGGAAMDNPVMFPNSRSNIGFSISDNDGQTWTYSYPTTPWGAGGPGGGRYSILHVPQLGALGKGRWIVGGYSHMLYSDDDGVTWSLVPSLPVFGTWRGLAWTGQYVIAVDNAGQTPANGGSPVGGYTMYSPDGISGWQLATIRQGGVPVSGGFSSIAITSGTAVFGSKQPITTFFDSVNDSTGTLRSYAFTMYDVNSTNSNGPNAASSLRTFRYELTKDSASWTPVNDGGVQEVVPGNGFFPTFIDDQHRAWSVGARGQGQSQYSKISWDNVHSRPLMGPIAIGGFVNNRDTPQAYTTVYASVNAISGVAVAGLADPAFGTTNSGSIAGATAFYGSQAGPGEFNTYGAQLGPATIRPVFPMMDDVYAFKLSDQPAGVYTLYGVSFALAPNRPQMVGYRPGLRGTEVSGSWEFMFGVAATHSFDPVLGYTANRTRAVWVRQVRLETVVDRSSSIFFQNPQRARLFGRSALVPAADGPHLKSIQSGSAAWDIGLISYQTIQNPEYGRTVSITSDSSAPADSYAVQVFITGDLYLALSASGVVDVNNPQPPWLLGGNSFGTPYIPDSSMSLGTGTAEQVDAAAAQQIFDKTVGIQTTLPGANDMTSFLNRQGYTQTTLERWNTTIATQASGSSSDYFPPSPL
jgi:hypothetical protein